MKRAFTGFKRNMNALFKCREIYENKNKNLDINSEKPLLSFIFWGGFPTKETYGWAFGRHMEKTNEFPKILSFRELAVLSRERSTLLLFSFFFFKLNAGYSNQISSILSTVDIWMGNLTKKYCLSLIVIKQCFLLVKFAIESVIQNPLSYLHKLGPVTTLTILLIT